jgi:hypothetical protein
MKIYKDTSGKIIIDGENVDILNKISVDLNVPNLIEVHNFNITGENEEGVGINYYYSEDLIIPNNKFLNRAELLEID